MLSSGEPGLLRHCDVPVVPGVSHVGFRRSSNEGLASSGLSSVGAARPSARERILFYSVSDEYGELSNFAPYPIRLDGVQWPTTEHFFQAQKFSDADVREQIRRAPNPGEAARIGRSRKLRLRPNWDSAKVGVMRRAVRAKFEQHPDLAALLLATGDAEIVEHTERDAFWGDGGDGRGENVLGRILMEVRSMLKGSAH
ncbi:MAG: NADAR family protein [Polyangiaceae bacterium]|nr:NADAR family protein [Polyangiaceae bacterium]